MVEAAARAVVVVVGEEPRRPGVILGQALEVGDRGRVGLRVPVLVDEDEVVREVQLVAVLEVGDDAVQVLQRHLPHDHPVVVFVDRPCGCRAGARGSTPSPRRGGATRRAWSRSSGSLAILAIASRRSPSTPRSIQKRSTSCIAALDLGVVPVEVGLLGHEAVQVVLLGGLVERPRRAAGLERPTSSRWARRARRTSRAWGCRGWSATRGTTGAGRSCGSGPSRGSA